MKKNIPQEGKVDCVTCDKDKRACKEKTCPCHNFGVDKRHTPKDTLRERFINKFVRTKDEYLMVEMERDAPWSANEILDFFESEIEKAEEKERERIKGILEGMKRKPDENWGLDFSDEEYNNALSEAIKKIEAISKDN